MEVHEWLMWVFACVIIIIIFGLDTGFNLSYNTGVGLGLLIGYTTYYVQIKNKRSKNK